MISDTIRRNLDAVRARIAEAARRAGRPVDSIRLIAVTKKHPADWVRPLVENGVLDLGENYPQELWEKAEALGDRPEIRWHLIGHLQGNKARKTLPTVRVVHAVDSLKLLRSLDDLAATMTDPPRVCLQVNCSGEPAKHGWEPSAIFEDAKAIAACKKLPIVGLMTMAGYDTTPDQARPAFAKLREIRQGLRDRTGLPLPELSMGMSGDFEAAIAEGSTMIRVGSALFEGVSD